MPRLTVGRPRAELIAAYPSGQPLLADGDAPGDPADAAPLIKWFNDGADGQIQWGQDGDFEACVAIAGQHVANPEGFCQERHIDATGAPAGKAPGESGATSARTRALAVAPPAAQTPPPGPAACPQCGEPVDQDARFCAKCGARQPAADAPSSAQITAASVPPPAAPAKPAPAPAAPAPADAPRDAVLVDEHGNVDPAATCANADCGHLASAHADDTAGQNTGSCGMANCSCPGMQVASSPSGQQSSADGAQDGDSGSEELAMGPGIAVPDAPAPAGPATSDSSTLNAPPAVAGSQNMGPAFTIPVGIIEGQPTGDGRQIATGALTWRTPPMPLMGLATETHDPEGFDQNNPAVLCGRIDSLERIPGQGDTQIVMAKGFYLPNEDGLYFAALTEAMGRCGISADVLPQAVDVEVIDADDEGFPLEMSETMAQGQILGFTQVPYPAFEGAYIVLGDGTDQPAAQTIPQQSEHVAPDRPPAAVTAGGQLIHLVAFEACEPCQQDVQVIVASGAGPQRPPRAWFENPNFTEGDGRLQEILDRRGERAIAGKFACPLTITDDGRVYGHLAPWDVCHIGKPGCVTAPSSASDYAYFKRGQHVQTAEGDRIRVGSLTVDVGHANVRAGSTEAMAHYDNIATVAADVNAGEDAYGIWIAGAIRPTASEQQVQALRASSISGDWRQLGGGLELVAALAVPVPGFPHAVVASGREEALLAAGAPVMHRLKHPAEPDGDPGDVALRTALAPLLSQSRALARDRVAALRR